ncbi:MAG: DUF882 domain-containing protein, partial [Nitrospirae bacterium]|nr:DUF882 domain-containing protein [Nitrospirota bacterium]
MRFPSSFSLNSPCDRRFFLKASLAGFALMLSNPGYSWARELLPEGRLNLLNIHTDERLTITYRNGTGQYDSGALKAIDWILRCHYTGQSVEIDTKTIEFL